jgi:hypothetical protein
MKQSIQQNENVALRATDFIVLDKGFTIEAGAEFFAEITPCQEQVIYREINDEIVAPPSEDFITLH